VTRKRTNGEAASTAVVMVGGKQPSRTPTRTVRGVGNASMGAPRRGQGEAGRGAETNRRRRPGAGRSGECCRLHRAVDCGQPGSVESEADDEGVLRHHCPRASCAGTFRADAAEPTTSVRRRGAADAETPLRFVGVDGADHPHGVALRPRSGCTGPADAPEPGCGGPPSGR